MSRYATGASSGYSVGMPDPTGWGRGDKPSLLEAGIVVDQEPRCWRCGRMLAWLTGRPWHIQCGRCKASSKSPPSDAPLGPTEGEFMRRADHSLAKRVAEWAIADPPAFAYLIAQASDPEVAKRARKYGITIEDLVRLIFAQQGRCAICREPGWSVDLHIDHDHDTGAVRGLLCRKCNTGLGQLGDEIDQVRQAATYLRRDRHNQKLRGTQ